jgi:prolipoprotein diacylglyceryltransferase
MPTYNGLLINVLYFVLIYVLALITGCITGCQPNPSRRKVSEINFYSRIIMCMDHTFIMYRLGYFLFFTFQINRPFCECVVKVKMFLKLFK